MSYSAMTFGNSKGAFNNMHVCLIQLVDKSAKQATFSITQKKGGKQKDDLLLKVPNR